MNYISSVNNNWTFLELADLRKESSINIYRGIKTMNTGITQAIKELKQAEQNFENADPEFVDIAIIQLLAAQMKVNMFYYLRKQNLPTPTEV